MTDPLEYRVVVNYSNIQTHTREYTYTHTDIHTYRHIHVCVHIYTHTHRHTNAHTYMHTYTSFLISLNTWSSNLGRPSRSLMLVEDKSCLKHISFTDWCRSWRKVSHLISCSSAFEKQSGHCCSHWPVSIVNLWLLVPNLKIGQWEYYRQCHSF